jgi:hypothetical protein
MIDEPAASRDLTSSLGSVERTINVVCTSMINDTQMRSLAACADKGAMFTHFSLLGIVVVEPFAFS